MLRLLLDARRTFVSLKASARAAVKRYKWIDRSELTMFFNKKQSLGARRTEVRTLKKGKKKAPYAYVQGFF